MLEIQETEKITRRPGVLRHIAAILYDVCLLFALLFFTTGLAVAINHGKAIGHGNIFFSLYLLFVCFMFYGWFWTHGGQTLGMRSWKIKLVSNHAQPVTWTQSAIRFSISFISNLAFGWGIWWPALTHQASWADMLSQTRLVTVPVSD